VFHVVVTLGGMYWFFARQPPMAHIKALVPATVTAFGTASSAVTLPTTIACCELRGYEPSIVRFVLSLGATISMDGTAMYYGPVLLWMAHTADVEVGAGSVIVVAVVATLISMGASPTPGAGAALFAIAWGTLFPDKPVPESIAFVIAIDWLMDRFQTATNVNGDAFVTGMVDAILKRKHPKGTSIGTALEASSEKTRDAPISLKSLAEDAENFASARSSVPKQRLTEREMESVSSADQV